MPKQKPTHEIRLGVVKATIWKNDTVKGGRYNTTFVRLYRDEDKWKNTGSFGRDDLLILSKIADVAHSWVCQQTQKERLGEESSSRSGSRR